MAWLICVNMRRTLVVPMLRTAASDTSAVLFPEKSWFGGGDSLADKRQQELTRYFENLVALGIRGMPKLLMAEIFGKHWNRLGSHLRVLKVRRSWRFSSAPSNQLCSYLITAVYMWLC